MSEQAATLLTEALKLSEEEFKAELDRRSAELREHPERAIPWEEVEKMR